MSDMEKRFMEALAFLEKKQYDFKAVPLLEAKAVELWLQWYNSGGGLDKYTKADAYYHFGKYYYYGLGIIKKDKAKAIEWYTKAAEMGQTAAQNMLGYCYYNGEEGTPQDFTKAVEWYTKATMETDSRDTFIKLADCYYYGKGVKQDCKAAIKWLRKRIDRFGGSDSAKLTLAKYYREGMKNTAEADRLEEETVHPAEYYNCY